MNRKNPRYKNVEIVEKHVMLDYIYMLLKILHKKPHVLRADCYFIIGYSSEPLSSKESSSSASQTRSKLTTCSSSAVRIKRTP